MQKIDQSFDGTFTDNIKSNAYKSQFANKKNKIIINVSETQYAVVKHVAKKYKWNLILDPVSALNFDICWVDGIARQDLFARMSPHQKINHFPGMGILSRKNNLGKNLMLFRRRFPSQYEFFPITWHLPEDHADLQAYHQCRQQGKAQTFIVKPQASCQGRGIYLTRNVQKLKFNEKLVVQRYLHKPYLIDGLKFDLRIYVLVAGVDPLRIFVFEEGLARFATEPYKPPRSQNLDNLFMHLTNYAINKNSQKFIFNESISDMSTGHKRSLTSIFKHLESEGHDVQLLKQRIYDIFIKTIITGYPVLSQTLHSVHPDNHSNDMCFEVLGFDIMLDHKLNPYLLQINYTPSFTADTPLDRFIKKKLIFDTLNLVGVNQKWKKQSKLKRDRQIQERMMSGKRKKYTMEERKILMREQAEKRNEYERENLGGYRKIFVLSQQQFKEYKKYYDYAMEVYDNLGKNQSYPQFQKPNNTPVVFYNSYFSEYQPTASNSNYQQNFGKQKKKDNYMTRDSLKNSSQILRETKLNESNHYQRTGHMSSSHGSGQIPSGSYNTNNSSVKRVSSAKSRTNEGRKERKIVYDCVESKKSLKIQKSKQRNDKSRQKNDRSRDRNSRERENTQKSIQVMQNNSIFQNKMIQNLLLKQSSKNHDPKEDLEFDIDY